MQRGPLGRPDQCALSPWVRLHEAPQAVGGLEEPEQAPAQQNRVVRPGLVGVVGYEEHAPGKDRPTPAT